MPPQSLLRTVRQSLRTPEEESRLQSQEDDTLHDLVHDLQRRQIDGFLDFISKASCQAAVLSKQVQTIESTNKIERLKAEAVLARERVIKLVQELGADPIADTHSAGLPSDNAVSFSQPATEQRTAPNAGSTAARNSVPVPARNRSVSETAVRASNARDTQRVIAPVKPASHIFRTSIELEALGAVVKVKINPGVPILMWQSEQHFLAALKESPVPTLPRSESSRYTLGWYFPGTVHEAFYLHKGQTVLLRVPYVTVTGHHLALLYCFACSKTVKRGVTMRQPSHGSNLHDGDPKWRILHLLLERAWPTFKTFDPRSPSDSISIDAPSDRWPVNPDDSSALSRFCNSIRQVKIVRGTLLAETSPGRSALHASTSATRVNQRGSAQIVSNNTAGTSLAANQGSNSRESTRRNPQRSAKRARADSDSSCEWTLSD